MKRWLALLLSVALLAWMAILPAVAETAAAEEVYRFPEQITLKVGIFDRGTTGNSAPDNNAWTKWIQENFGDPRNIKMEWVVIPRTEEVDKLNALMASGEAADISFTYTEAVVTNFVAQGGLYDLGELIGQYGSNLKAFLGEDLLKYGMFEGKQYAVPARRIVLADRGVFIRKDWLDKLNLAMPTTKEALYNALVAFRDQNPGNVEGGCIPFAMGADPTWMQIIRFSFLKDLSAKTLATVPDVAQEGFADYMVWLNKLYNEKLISPDFALDTSSINLSDAAAGKAGVYEGNYDHPIRVSPGVQASLNAIDPDALYAPLNCFESVTDASKYYHPQYAPNGIFTIVPIFAQHADAAVMYLDWMAQYPVLYYLQNGVEGVTYNLNADGIPVLENVEGDYHFNSMQNLDYTLIVNGQYLDDPSLLMKAQATSYQGYANLYEEMYTVGTTDPIVNSFHFDTVLAADSQYNTSLLALKKEMYVKCMMAKPEECLSVYQELLGNYMAQGGQAVMDEKIAAWDAMNP